MTLDEVRALALAMPDAIESSHHGHPDFRVGKRIFATLQPERNRSALRLPLPYAENLESEDPMRFKVVSRKGSNGWLIVDLAQISKADFMPLIELAYGFLAHRS